MKKNYLLSGTLLFLAGALSIANAEVIYVTESGAGSGDGSTWSNAATLEDAFSWASTGTEIYIAKGTYTGSFKLRAEAKVYGNCEGTETEPPTYTTAEGLETFLKGTGDSRVLYLDGKASELYGLDISGGDASLEKTGVGRGGGVYINNGGATLKYCNIHDNVGVDGSRELLGSNGKPQKGVGGGLYILNGRLENCIIENNIATKAPWVDSQVWATGIGGGICLDATEGNGCNPDKAVVLNCIIRNNSTTPADDEDSFASQGGGIAIKSGKLVNSLVIGNSVNGSLNNQSIGGGVACTEKEAYVINCTVVKNHAQGLGGGISFQTTNADGMTASVSNCIAWDNTCREDEYGEGNANIRLGNSKTDGKLPERVTIGAVCVPEKTVSTGAITVDPRFVNATGGDYRLSEGSPCIDAGDDPAIEGFDTDLAGNARIFGSSVDLGAYESTDGSAIDEIEAYEGEVVRTQYYTLQGVEVTYPSVSGVYIVKKTLDTNQVITEKVFVAVK